MSDAPARGDIWDVTLDPVLGHEQAGRRPCLIISADAYNQGPAGLVAVVPLTSRSKGIPLHVPIDPPNGGLTVASVIMCDQIRTISIQRLIRKRGSIDAASMREIDDRLKIFLGVF